MGRILVAGVLHAPTNWWACCCLLSSIDQNALRTSPGRIFQSADQQSVSDPSLVSLVTKPKNKSVHQLLGGDFSITVQPILKMFTVLETVIQVLHFFLCNLFDILAHYPRKIEAYVDLHTFVRVK